MTTLTSIFKMLLKSRPLVNDNRTGSTSKYIPWAIKRSQLVFVCNFVKNQRILIQFFSLLDFEMNDTCEGMNLTHVT